MRLLILLFLLLHAVGLAQGPKLQYYFAPASSTSLAIENDFLWIGTPFALIRFNINTYEKVFFQPNNSGLPSCRILSIAVDKDGIKWIGTPNGLVRYDGINWTVFTKSNSKLPDNEVWSISIDLSGNKWIGTRSGALAKFTGESWEIFKIPDSSTDFLDITAVDKIGNIWVSTANYGIFKFNGQNWTQYTYKDKTFPYIAPLKIVVDSENNIWTGSPEDGCIVPNFCRFDGNKWELLNNIHNDSMPFNYVYRLCANTQGFICVLTDKMLFEYWNGVWKQISSIGIRVRSAVVDRNENRWFTTTDGELLKYDGKDWTSFSLSNSGMSQNGVNSIAVDQNGRAWIACGSYGMAAINGTIGKPGLTFFNGKAWETFDTTDCPALKDQILATAIDRNNLIWLGTCGSGLISYDGNTWKTYTHSNSGLTSDIITSIAFDSTGNTWIGTSNGIAKFDGKTWKSYENLPIFSEKYNIENIAAGKDEIAWIGINSNSIASFNGRDWSYYTVKAAELPNVQITSFAIDKQNRKWITTYNGLLVCIDAEGEKVFYPPARKSQISTAKSEYSPLTSIAIDKQGNKWMGSVDRILKFDGRIWTVYNLEEYGLPNINISIITIDPQGNKWVGAHYDIGLIVFNENGLESPGN